MQRAAKNPGGNSLATMIGQPNQGIEPMASSAVRRSVQFVAVEGLLVTAHPRRWAYEVMRALYIVAIFVLFESSLPAGDATPSAQIRPLVTLASTNRAPQSYMSDYRGLPAWFSPDEVATRTWKRKDGQTIRR
jgi:hypothetical protein